MNGTAKGPRRLITASRVAALVAGAAALSSVPSCGRGGAIPEPGAALVKVTADDAALAAAPDELRIWAYDDHGRLWDGVRVPDQGAVALRGPRDYGTLLIQPGAIDGPLRLHVRALAAGLRVADGVMSVAASQRGKAAVELQLSTTPVIDADGDDVPDEIDDCPGVINPLQGGCGVAPDASDDGPVVDVSDGSADAGALEDSAPPDGDGGAPDVDGKETGEPDGLGDAGGDGAPIDGTCAAGAGGAAGCPQPNGAPCASSGQCSSGVCADGVCCNAACGGPCRSCNQPGTVGMCQAYTSGADPERECAPGAACNGAGACVALPDMKKANGQPCSGATQCVSGFCADGVCCNTACGDACQSCSTGTCLGVKRADDVPECAGTKTCNPKGDCVTK